MPTPLPIIAVDGIDGAGKSTLCRLLTKVFRDFTDQPVESIPMLGPGPRAQFARQVLIEAPASHHYYSAPILMASASLETYDCSIVPAVESGRVVIVDRWLASYYAYQCVAEDSALAHTLYTHHLVPHIPPPALYLWCDLSPTAARVRLQARGQQDPTQINHYDEKPLAYVTRLQQAYQQYYDTARRITPDGHRVVRLAMLDYGLNELEVKLFEILHKAHFL